jgi:hypothetical protein
MSFFSNFGGAPDRVETVHQGKSKDIKSCGTIKDRGKKDPMDSSCT